MLRFIEHTSTGIGTGTRRTDRIITASTPLYDNTSRLLRCNLRKQLGELKACQLPLVASTCLSCCRAHLSHFSATVRLYVYVLITCRAVLWLHVSDHKELQAVRLDSPDSCGLAGKPSLISSHFRPF